MKWRRSRKPAIFLTVLIFLTVGGAAAFLYVIDATTDPVVAADIDAHFAAIEADGVDMPVFLDDRSGLESDVVLYSGRDNGGAAKEKNRAVKPEKRKRRHGKQVQKPESQPESRNGITKVDSGTWLIEEKTYRHARKNLMTYVGSAQAELAENDDGRPIGFRLRNIKNNSYLRDIGLRNNDVLVAINGHRLNSVENVTLAIASFQDATRFRLDLLRKEKKRSFYYKIVKGDA